MEHRRGRRLAIGCGVGCLLLAVPYLGMGMLNLAYNDLTLTHSLTQEIEDLSRPRHEFRSDLDRARIIEGHYLGDASFGGGLRHHLQFDDVLRGDGRILDLYVDHERFGPTFLSDASESAAEGIPAYLWLQLTCCMEQDAWYELFEIEAGDEKNAPEMMQRLFGYALPTDTLEMVLVHLDFANVFQFSSSWFFLTNQGGDRWVVTERGSSVAQDYDLDLAWIQRDPSEIRMKKLAYVATIPLDVVGWPLHILALIGLSGGVV